MTRALRTFVALVGWLAAGCEGRDRQDPGPDGILLVTVSSARADRFDPDSPSEAATPSFAALTETGTSFTRAYAHSPATLPSLASLLTGLVPRAHGVVAEGTHALGGATITLAERLGRAGWATSAVTGGPYARSIWGLDRGFERFDDSPPVPAGGELLPPFSRADEVVDRAIEVIESSPTDRPLFLWVHLHDPHWPIDPPEPWRSAYPGAGYDAEIAFVDAALGRLVEAWDERSFAHRSVVAVTADHGESLGEEGEQTHGVLLHESTLRVPLVVRAAGIEAGLRSTDPVGHTDLAATLVALARADRRGLQGTDVRKGGSETIWHESPSGRLGLGFSALTAATGDQGRFTEGAWSSFSGVHDPPPAVGDRAAPDDPRGAVLVAVREGFAPGVAPEVVLDARTLETLAAIGYVSADPTVAPGTVDPRDASEALALLAQVRQHAAASMSGEAGRALDGLTLRLGQDASGVAHLRAAWLKRQGRLPEAAQTLEAAWTLSPLPTWALQVAELEAAMGDWRGASAWAAAVLDEAPDTPDALAIAIRAAVQAGDREGADALSATFAAAFPDHPLQALARAETWLPQQPDAALAEIGPALDGQPGNPWALQLLGAALWARGDTDAAIEVMQRALRVDPYQSATRILLVRCLLEVGRNAEATRVAAALARMLPEDPAAQELYATASLAVTTDEKFELRRDRARGPRRTLP